MSQERSEKPTWRRLQDARRRGEIARSREVHEAFQFGMAVLALSWAGDFILRQLAGRVASGLVAVGELAHSAIGPGDLAKMTTDYGATLAMTVAPVAAAAVIGGIAAVSVQGGWVFSWQPLAIKFSRLDPRQGLSRLAPSRAGLDLVRVVIVTLALGWVGYGVVHAVMGQTSALGRVAPADAAHSTWVATITFFWRSLVVLGAVAAADYGLNWWRYRRSLRMTKQEVKEEHRMHEGNPEIKARVRRVQRDMMRRRMLAAVPKATIVITNPTHVAVALEYVRERMAAPRVVAKGADHMAMRIKEVAREHGVATVENVALARALYAGAEVGDPIPGDLFEAVAEVIAYLVRLKQVVL